MKNFPRNLLIVLAVCLWALVAFQWVRENRLRQDLLRLNEAVQRAKESAYGLEQSHKRDIEEIKRLDALKNQLAQSVKSNEARLSVFERDLQRASAGSERSASQLRVYKAALDRANSSIESQNETIKTQNDEILKLAEERNSIISNFNKLSRDYNELAERWNRQQQDLAAATTNATAQRK
jgi:septal ring factor EnvC (AmiA/AmiB activator)